MPPADPSPTAAELTPTQRDFVTDCCQTFFELADAAGVSERDLTEGDAAEACDAVVRWWHDQPGDDRPDFETTCNILGVALGELLRAAFPILQWKMVSDGFGTSLALWNPSPQVILAPIDSVMKRLDEEPDGFFAPLLDALVHVVESSLDGKPPSAPDADD